MIRGAVLAAALVAALAGTAHAATVSVHRPPCSEEQSKYGQCYSDEARFIAAPGEQNRVTITAQPSAPPDYQPRLQIRDDGAPLTAGAGCRQDDAHTATCTGYNLIATVDAGDGNDSVSGGTSVDGGAGDDTITGAETEHGGPGDDTLVAADSGSHMDGGAGHDRITGGPGNDTILDPADPGESDVVTGGDGRDMISYAGRRAGMTVSLQQPLAGEDQLAGIEDITGGAGGDTLIGDAGPNVLSGGGGNDTIDGGDGADALYGERGTNTIDGGAGDDKLSASEPGSRNRVRCGSGNDRVDPSANTLVAADCERIGIDEFTLNGTALLRLPLRAAGAPVLVLRPQSCVYPPCRIGITLSGARGTVLGAAHVLQRAHGRRLPRQIELRLNTAGRRALAAPGPLRAHVQIASDESGDRLRAAFLVDL